MATRLQMSRDFQRFMHKAHLRHSKLEEAIPHKFSRLYDAEHKGALGYGTFSSQLKAIKQDLAQRIEYLQEHSTSKTLYGKLRHQLQNAQNCKDLHRVFKNGIWLLENYS